MSHINKIETMQAKMVNAPWYVINEDKEINDKKKNFTNRTACYVGRHSA